MTTTNYPATINLQHIGQHSALPAQDLVVGDVLVWNGGSTSKVTKIEQASKCFLLVTVESYCRIMDTTTTYERRLKIGRLVACERAAEMRKALRAAQA